MCLAAFPRSETGQQPPHAARDVPWLLAQSRGENGKRGFSGQIEKILEGLQERHEVLLLFRR